jgi:hypothetical protein
VHAAPRCGALCCSHVATCLVRLYGGEWNAADCLADHALRGCACLTADLVSCGGWCGQTIGRLHGCARHSDGCRYEADVVLGASEWLEMYPMDYYAKGGGGWSNYAAPRMKEDELVP